PVSEKPPPLKLERRSNVSRKLAPIKPPLRNPSWWEGSGEPRGNRENVPPFCTRDVHPRAGWGVHGRPRNPNPGRRKTSSHATASWASSPEDKEPAPPESPAPPATLDGDPVG